MFFIIYGESFFLCSMEFYGKFIFRIKLYISKVISFSKIYIMLLNSLNFLKRPKNKNKIKFNFKNYE